MPTEQALLGTVVAVVNEAVEEANSKYKLITSPILGSVATAFNLTVFSLIQLKLAIGVIPSFLY